jgi:hypothetical protein
MYFVLSSPTDEKSTFLHGNPMFKRCLKDVSLLFERCFKDEEKMLIRCLKMLDFSRGSGYYLVAEW